MTNNKTIPLNLVEYLPNDSLLGTPHLVGYLSHDIQLYFEG